MHLLLVFVTALLCISAVFSIIALAIDENLTPVGKTFGSLFVGCCALVLTLQTILDHTPGGRLVEAVQAAHYLGHTERAEVVDAAPAQVIEQHSAQVVEAQRAVVAAPAAAQVVVAQPQSDSTKDMLLGGMVGYMMGSGGGRGGDTHTVTSHTTVIHNAAPVVASAPHPAPPAAAPTSAPHPASAAPAAAVSRPVVASAPAASRPTWRSTFSMTRSRR